MGNSHSHCQYPPTWQLATHLFGSQVEVLAEGEPQHIQVLAPVAESGQDVAKHFSLLHVLRVDEHHAIWRREAELKAGTPMQEISVASTVQDIEYGLVQASASFKATRYLHGKIRDLYVNFRYEYGRKAHTI